MGGKGKPQAQNDQMMQFQMQQAAQAKQDNLERNARLQQGVKSINQIFQGGGGTQGQLDLSGISSKSAWAYDPFRANGTIWNESTKTWDKDPAAQLSGGYSWGVEKPEGGDVRYALYGPDGYKISTAATPEDLAKSTIFTGDGGGGGGFGDAFYDKYRKAQLDYYLPQEAEQYAGARSNLGYSLARAGQLNSSTAAMDVAKLSKQDELNRAQMAAQADTSTGQLRQQIQQEQEQALNQLYSTEDPSVAALTATNMAANASLTKPMLNPAGALFTPIVAGVGNALGGFMNQQAYINPGQSGVGGAGTSSEPMVASTSSGSGDQGGTVRGYG
jgi:hypothetical protein